MTYHEKLIELDTIYALSREGLTLQQEECIKTVVEKNKEMFEHCMTTPIDGNEQFALERKDYKIIVKKHGFKNISPHNYVLSHQAIPYIFKIPSPEFKRSNNQYLTYKGAGRVAVNLLIKKFCEEEKSRFIKPVPTYLWSLAGSYNDVSDRNCFAVEEKMSVKLLNHLSKEENKKILTSTCLKEILEVTLYAGLWDMHQGNIGVEENGTIGILDSELSSINKPENFFYKFPEGEKELLFNTCNGIERIFNWFKRTSKHRALIQNFVNKYRDRLQEADNFNMIACYLED